MIALKGRRDAAIALKGRRDTNIVLDGRRDTSIALKGRRDVAGLKGGSQVAIRWSDTAIVFARGEDITLQFTIEDSAGAAVNITSWNFKFEVRQKLTDPNAEISVTPTIINAATGRVDAVITEAATQDLPIVTRRRHASLWRSDAGAKSRLAYGEITIEDEATVV